jgi:hypothetical protein
VGEVVEKVAVEIEGRDNGASASLKSTADVVRAVTAQMRDLHRASTELARETIRNAQQASKSEQEKANAAARSSAALVALQQRAEQQRKTILARGDPLAQLRLQLQQEIAAYRQIAAQVVGQEEQKQRTLRAIRERYLAAKKALLAEEQRAESAAAAGTGAARPGRFGIQSLRRFNEPMEGARMALGALGATTNTTVGQLGFLAQAFANVGAKAGAWGALLVGVGAGLTALHRQMQEVAAQERQIAAMGRTWGVTAADVRAVEAAWRAAGIEIDRSGVLKLIAAGKEANLATAEIVELGLKAKDVAEASGRSFEDGFVAGLADVKDAANDARKAFEDLLEAKRRAEAESKSTPEIYAADEAIRASREAIDRMQRERQRLLAEAAAVREGRPGSLSEAIEQAKRATGKDREVASLDEKIAAEEKALERRIAKRRELNKKYTEEQATMAEAQAGQELLDKNTRAGEEAKRRADEAARQAEQRWQESIREGLQLQKQVETERQKWRDQAFAASFSDEERGKIELRRRQELEELERHIENRRRLYQDEADVERERQERLADIQARYSRGMAELAAKRAKEEADAKEKADAEAKRVQDEAKDALQKNVDYFVIGMRAGEQYITGLKAALEAKKTKDKVAGALKTIGAVLSMIPTPETQAAGAVFSFFGSLASAFHDGGAVGVRGERLTAHDGRYIDQGRRPVWALPGEGFLDVATTALVGGSRGIERLNRAAETGGTAGLGGGVHIGGISVRIDGSKIDNLAALERAIGPALERAIVHNVGRVPRRIGREIGPLTR